MNRSTNTNSESEKAHPRTTVKRIILSIGGKGGVGNTTVIAGLAEWFQMNHICVKLLDFGPENRGPGSLTHVFGCRVSKVNIHTPAGLDVFVDRLQHGPP